MKILVRFNNKQVVGEFATFPVAKKAMLDHFDSTLPERGLSCNYREVFIGETTKNTTVSDQFGYYLKTDRELKTKIAHYAMEFLL